MKAVRIFLLGLFTIAALAYLNIIIPKPQSDATHNPPNADTCGSYILVTTNENPGSCNNSDYSADLKNTTYSATYTIQSVTGQRVHAVYNTEDWYCPEATPHDEPGNPTHISCRQNGSFAGGDVWIDPGTSQPVTITGRQASCGSQQTDFSFDLFDTNGHKLCSYGNPNFVWGHSFCSTGVTCGQPTPTNTPAPTNTPTPMPTSTPTPTVTSTPTPTVSITPPPHRVIVKKHVINDDGGTKKAEDFTIFVENAYNGQILTDFQGSEAGTTVVIPAGILYKIFEGNHDGYVETLSGACSNGGPLYGNRPIIQPLTCTITNDDISGTPTPTPTGTLTPTPTGVTPTEGCTSNCGNITINVEQQQQQQQVLAATVAPAPTTSSLPSTGASDLAVIPTLISLIAAGWKLRKLV